MTVPLAVTNKVKKKENANTIGPDYKRHCVVFYTAIWLQSHATSRLEE
jgi:hypothetical protein